eukprot:3186711-Pyramimonas_sp.AAC.2
MESASEGAAPSRRLGILLGARAGLARRSPRLKDLAPSELSGPPGARGPGLPRREGRRRGLSGGLAPSIFGRWALALNIHRSGPLSVGLPNSGVPATAGSGPAESRTLHRNSQGAAARWSIHGDGPA